MGEDTKHMRYLSVCSGIEAASVAWESLGWTPVGFSEIEPFPCRVLQHHYPNVKNYGDMTKYKEWDIDGDSVDLLVGGTPCQAFSVAGLRKGLEDPRGNLSLVFVGMVEHFKPEWVVWENVPGVLSSNGGRDFGSFIGALASIGYGFSWRCLDAQHFGVPQRRRRIFLVGHSSGDSRRAAEVLFEPESLRGDTEKGNRKRTSFTSSPTPSVDANGIQRTVGTLCADTHPGAYSGQDAYTGRLVPVMYENHPNDSRVTGPVDPSPTVAARWGTGGGNTPLVGQPIPIQDVRPIDKGQNGLGIGNEGDPSYTLDKMATQGVAYKMAVRRLTPTEVERLQGFPDGYTDISANDRETPDGPRYKSLGNSMAVPCMRYIGERIQGVSNRM
jgi:DNA (cytosine-5)-methyltransferase 1